LAIDAAFLPLRAPEAVHIARHEMVSEWPRQRFMYARLAAFQTIRLSRVRALNYWLRFRIL